MKETTEPQKTSDNARKDAQLAAVIASSVIAVGFVIYWTIQIQDMLEMLALAYG